MYDKNKTTKYVGPVWNCEVEKGGGKNNKYPTIYNTAVLPIVGGGVYLFAM